MVSSSTSSAFRGFAIGGVLFFGLFVLGFSLVTGRFVVAGVVSIGNVVVVVVVGVGDAFVEGVVAALVVACVVVGGAGLVLFAASSKTVAIISGKVGSDASSVVSASSCVDSSFESVVIS